MALCRCSTFFLVLFVFQNIVCERYVVVKEPANWFQALINCKNAGMELASVNSEEESKALNKYLKDNGYNVGYWLAGTNLGDGDFYWVTTGIKLVYTNWLVGQPDNARMDYNKNEGEHCIQLGMPSYQPDPNGWNDLGCHAELAYICQKEEVCYQEKNTI